MAEDMADLTYLNDASVLENLRARYYKRLIYVSLHGADLFHCGRLSHFPHVCLMPVCVCVCVIDLLGSLLCDGESVQALPHLLVRGRHEVQGEEAS